MVVKSVTQIKSGMIVNVEMSAKIQINNASGKDYI